MDQRTARGGHYDTALPAEVESRDYAHLIIVKSNGHHKFVPRPRVEEGGGSAEDLPTTKSVSKPKVATYEPLNEIAMWPSSSTEQRRNMRILERTASYREKTLMHERRPPKEQGKRSEVKHYFSAVTTEQDLPRVPVYTRYVSYNCSESRFPLNEISDPRACTRYISTRSK